MTLQDLFLEGKETLYEAQIQEWELDAWYLREYVTGMTRSRYFLDPHVLVGQKDREDYQKLLKKFPVRNTVLRFYKCMRYLAQIQKQRRIFRAVRKCLHILQNPLIETLDIFRAPLNKFGILLQKLQIKRGQLDHRVHVIHRIIGQLPFIH